MRLKEYREHPATHAALSNVGIDQHHDRPENIEVSNTSLLVYPLPSGPYTWDISVPLNAKVVKFSFRSNHTVAEGGGKAGVHGIATRNQFETTVFSLGGHGTTSITSYNAVYSKVASATNLSHKVFSQADTESVCLTDAYLTLISGTERVLRTIWTNYGGSIETLNCWGEVQVIG
ncbi:MAG: hypothetical protein PVG39_00135 [Desulfobacteraceae bacterium]|jgi:hypothetical protein